MLFKHGFFFYCFALLLGFKSKAQHESKSAVEKTAFYTIAVAYDSVKHKTAYTVKSINVIDKATKPQSNIRYEKSIDHLLIKIIDKSKHVSQISTEHPLYKYVELFSESGEIGLKLISLPQGEVIFRVPYYEPFKKIKITEVRNFKKKKTVTIRNEK